MTKKEKLLEKIEEYIRQLRNDITSQIDDFEDVIIGIVEDIK